MLRLIMMKLISIEEVEETLEAWKKKKKGGKKRREEESQLKEQRGECLKAKDIKFLQPIIK